MTVHRELRFAAVAACVLTVSLLSGCSGSSGGSGTAVAQSTTNTSSGPGSSATSPGTSAAPTTSSSVPSASGSGAKCTDLTAAAASASVGNATTVTLDASVSPLPGLTICNVAVAGEVYPIQLAVNTKNAQADYSGEQQAFSGVDLSGVGDKAFSSSTGIEVLSGSVDIQITGPAGPVLNKNYTVPTAIAKAMISALK